MSVTFDDLPIHESIRSTEKFVSGKVNLGLLVRFLRTQVGQDWDDVYAEIISRIPTKLLDYKGMIFRFLADKGEIVDGRPWNKKTQQFLWTGEIYGPEEYAQFSRPPEMREFYVDPQTNKLIRIEPKAGKSIYRKE